MPTRNPSFTIHQNTQQHWHPFVAFVRPPGAHLGNAGSATAPQSPRSNRMSLWHHLPALVEVEGPDPKLAKARAQAFHHAETKGRTAVSASAVVVAVRV